MRAARDLRLRSRVGNNTERNRMIDGRLWVIAVNSLGARPKSDALYPMRPQGDTPTQRHQNSKLLATATRKPTPQGGGYRRENSILKLIGLFNG